jgi:hypothetical protein
MDKPFLPALFIDSFLIPGKKMRGGYAEKI